ncbi:rRNA adenine N-6-methyltransferase family protein [Dermatobacter hominis]|uniref:rRNA adenine N-6-methyltransferase family protein n=1 Tax=Dermatobacter hominis TaxID=2884263 RepID=UPI001D12A326|nr:rRNA adenine N-6-methyltransferase family protein [Dermatobacter hominis]UDY35681.1 methyltransferase domain-containing protein [Dermatobacter hominis]
MAGRSRPGGGTGEHRSGSPPGGTRRRWGWHELAPDAARRLVRASGVGAGDLVLDVGAGTGALTRELVAAGARVVAVEAHPGRAAELRRRFGTSDGVTVVRADAADLRLPRRPFRVVANPPFSVTSPILRRLLAPGSRLTDAHLVLQHHAAVRWCGPEAPAWGRWARSWEASLGPAVARSSFRPAPAVDCRVLVLRRR